MEWDVLPVGQSGPPGPAAAVMPSHPAMLSPSQLSPQKNPAICVHVCACVSVKF